MPIDKELVNSRILDIRNTMSELARLTNRRFDELSIDQLYSIRYNIIILVESLVSLATHILIEKYGYTPRYYVEAVEELAKRLNVACTDDLKKLVRLRNLHIHRYRVVDDRRIYEDVRRNFRRIEEVLGRIEAIGHDA